MSKHTTTPVASSSPTWESLDAWVREKTQEFIQNVMIEEVTEFLGRRKSQRLAAVDAVPGYRNGDWPAETSDAWLRHDCGPPPTGAGAGGAL